MATTITTSNRISPDMRIIAASVFALALTGSAAAGTDVGAGASIHGMSVGAHTGDSTDPHNRHRHRHCEAWEWDRDHLTRFCSRWGWRHD